MAVVGVGMVQASGTITAAGRKAKRAPSMLNGSFIVTVVDAVMAVKSA